MKHIAKLPGSEHLRRLGRLVVRHRVHQRLAAISAGVGATLSLTFSPQPPFDGPAGLRLTAAQSQMVQSGIRPNVLTTAQAKAISEAVARLSSHDFGDLQVLLKKADSDLERDYILKQVEYGSPIWEVTQLAQEIHGQSEDWLLKNMVLVDERVNTFNPVANGIAQQRANSCFIVDFEGLTGDDSPADALFIHQGGPINVGDSSNQRLVDDQIRLLIESGTTVGPNGDDDGGVFLSVGEAQFNAIQQKERAPGYTLLAVDPRDPKQVDKAIKQIEHYLDLGYRVPLVTSSQVPNINIELVGSHATLALQHQGNNIEVASNQYVGWVSEDQIRQDDLTEWLGGGSGLLGKYLIAYYIPNGPIPQPQPTFLPNAVFPERQRLHHQKLGIVHITGLA